MATMKTHCEGINFEVIEWWKGREIREVSTSRKYFHIMEKVIDFLLEMMKVCLHNLITMSTIEQLLYISWTVVFKPTFSYKQAILNKCQNKSLKHIVNYTLPPHRYVNKTCTECKKIAQKFSANWKALKPLLYQVADKFQFWPESLYQNFLSISMS